MQQVPLSFNKRGLKLVVVYNYIHKHNKYGIKSLGRDVTEKFYLNKYNVGRRKLQCPTKTRPTSGWTVSSWRKKQIVSTRNTHPSDATQKITGCI